MARAKIEAKKHFDNFPNATDVEQQTWIEEKVRLDFGRLLDRLAAQLNSEIVGMPLFQIGYAEHFFNKASNPQLAEVGNETVSAARLIADVLPALTESVVSPRHQRAADTLVYALVHYAPPQSAFIAAIFMLAQDHQVLSGLDKLMGNIFLPKTGSQLSQLARKRAINGSDQSGSGSGLNSFSSTPTAAPIWHWKEPATIANSIRYTSPSMKNPAPVNAGFNHTVVQPYHQDPLPPPIVVQAEIYRPPPPPAGYYQSPYSYPPNQPQNFIQNDLYPGLAPNMAPPSNWAHQVNHDSRLHGNWSTPLPFDAHPGSYQQPGDAHARSYGQELNAHAESYQQPVVTAHAGAYQPTHNTQAGDYQKLLHNDEGYRVPENEAASPAISPQKSGTPIVNIDTSEAYTPSEARIISPPLATDPNVDKSMSAQLPSSPSELRTEPSAETDGLSDTPQEPLVRSDPAPGESFPRRSSRGTILTSKAKAAGILLGTQSNSPCQTSFSRVSKTPKPHNASTSPEANSEVLPAAGGSASEAASTLALARSTAVDSKSVMSKEPQDGAMDVEGFVPRSSGRERKPTAKILASTALRSGAKVLDYSSSVPRVSSKLRLSLSSQSSTMSEDSTESKATATDKSLSPSSKSQTSPEAAEALAASVCGREPIISNIKTRLKKVTSRETQVNLPTVGSGVDSHSVTPIHVSSKKDQRFLTNDKGQRMGQALLLMAQVAAEWSDSDDEDEPTSEREFQSKLQEAVDKRIQQNKSNANTAAQGHLSLKISPTLSQPVNGVLPTTSWTTRDHSGSLPHYSNGVARSNALTRHQPVLLPSPGPQSSATNASTDLRSISQITDDWVALVKLKDEARTHGMPINDSMSLDQLTDLLTAYYAGEHDVANKPAMRTLVPSPARPVALSGAPAHLSTGLDQGMRQQSTDSRTSDSSGRSRARRSTAQHTSQYDFNPQGLNGGPPGGGTIIMNGPETRVAQAKQRQNSKGLDETSTTGSTAGTRNSTPSTRDARSTTPQPRIQTPPVINFKKGGIILSFGNKAKRAAASSA